MAKIAKPKGTKGQPAEEASQTLSQNGELIGLNFKIEPEFRREFKTYAAEHDLSMLDRMSLPEAYSMRLISVLTRVWALASIGSIWVFV